MPWIAPVVGGVLSIGQGIFGASQADAQNRKAERQYKKQQKLAKKQADITNDYLQRAFEAEKNDYFAARQFQYDSQVRQWKYDVKMQDYAYLQKVKEYGKSAENYIQQITFNTVAGQIAYESQQAAFNELLASLAFESEGSLLESVKNQGNAAMLQAGGGRAKAIQSSLAEAGMNASRMAAELRSGAEEAVRGLRDVSLQKYGADLNAAANLMIRPEPLPRIPAPVMGPERTFVAPAKVLPGAVPPPQYQSVAMPLISGITSATTGILGAYNFSTGQWD